MSVLSQSDQPGPVPEFLQSVERLTSGFSALTRQSLDKIKDGLALRDAENAVLAQENRELRAEIDQLKAAIARSDAERSAALATARSAEIAKAQVVDEQKRLLAATDVMMRSFGRGMGIVGEGGSRIGAFEEIARARVKYGVATETQAQLEPGGAASVVETSAAEIAHLARPLAEPVRSEPPVSPQPLADTGIIELPRRVQAPSFRVVPQHPMTTESEIELAAGLAEFTNLLPGRRDVRMMAGA
ncbi:hypothetical protein [Bosea sp. RAC05]|uniref:hypothetical protein n=1 Tax=Bosea sp. RAC05 TaxID=1842539 RepID=UPI00083D0271|nr:hypothetical protein [Bosea sp. RAC05]AOG02960.1 hypothetical protein BSY19_5295 [Bosea sp. RAC05]